jgi:hypothetical protein
VRFDSGPARFVLNLDHLGVILTIDQIMSRLYSDLPRGGFPANGRLVLAISNKMGITTMIGLW